MKHYKIRQSITDRSSISVNLYLKDIAKYPLLTQEEEVQLITDAKQNKNDRSKDKLIQSNLRFVVSIAKQYQGKGIDFPDLIECGNLGLIKAIDDFDPSQGLRFLSYAVWWIRNFILQEIAKNGNLIRIPTGKITEINKINKCISKFEQENQRAPTSSEISEITDIEEEKVDELMGTAIQIIENVAVNQEGSEEDILETLSSPIESDEDLNTSSKTFEIDSILKKNLKPVEYDVITLMFGINRTPMRIDDISEEYNITKERIRQIKDKAIIKLRKSVDINKLKNYL